MVLRTVASSIIVYLTNDCITTLLIAADLLSMHQIARDTDGAQECYKRNTLYPALSGVIVNMELRKDVGGNGPSPTPGAILTSRKAAD